MERAGKYVVHVILPLSKEERGDKEVFVPWALYQERGEEKAKKAAKTAKGVRLLDDMSSTIFLLSIMFTIS